jgi:2-polyprenyl-3-methyl-5-hydroxy-6-metoxy-1,4-benzoquinol methylase
MPERLNKCPLCKSGHFLNHLEITDHALSKENFILCRCTACQLLFTNPRPNSEEIGKYYEFPEYYSHDDDKSQTITQRIYQLVRTFNIRKKVKLINSLKKKGRLLDYGCGTGEFLKEAKKSKWKINGIEPSDKARTKANKKLSDAVKRSVDEFNKEKRFDIITLFHVLEHIHDLRKTLKLLLKHLNSNGYFLIAIPNSESWDAKKYKGHWAAWDVPRHLYHFNSQSVEYLKKEFKLDLLEIRPMKLDSYYVSLLSENYLNPKQSLIIKYWKALTNGYRSNYQAKQPGEYSSNLYIFKKSEV